jgi:hypothetical protein
MDPDHPTKGATLSPVVKTQIQGPKGDIRATRYPLLKALWSRRTSRETWGNPDLSRYSSGDV